MDEHSGHSDGHVEPLERETLLAALQTREQFLSRILGGLESFVTIDEDWRITFANAAALRTTGLDEDELLGRDLRDLARAAFAKLDLAPLERAMRDRKTTECEAATAGREQIYHCTAYPLADGGLAVYARDVTEREREREARRASDDLYRELVQGVNSVVVRWSREGRFTFFNAYAERLFGWRSEEVVGEPVTVILPESGMAEEDLSHLADDILADPERYATNVNENVTRDGRRLWMAWTNRALRDEQGNVTEVLGTASDITELVEAQRALRVSEGRYRSMVETSAAGILIGSPEGVIEFANHRFAEMLGYTVDELVGLSGPVITFEQTETERAEVRRELREGKAVANEIKLRRKDGTPVWTRYSASPLYDADRVHVGNLAVHIDITMRKQAEEALRISEERLRLAQLSGDVGVFDWDVATDALVWTPELEAIWGLEPGTVSSYEDFRRRVHPEDLEEMEEQRDAAVRDRRHFDLQFRIIRPSGEIRWVISKGRAFYDVDGDPVRILGNNIDVTARRRAEEELRTSQERLQLATEAAGIGAFDWDIVSGVNLWTPELEAMYGLAPGEFGRSQPAWEQLVHEEDRAAAIALVDDTLRTGRPVQGMWRVLWRDGSVHWISGRFRGVKDESGKPVRLIGVNVDVTELVEAQIALRESEQAAERERDLLLALVNSIRDDIWYADADGKVSLVNPSTGSKSGVFHGGQMEEIATEVEVRRPDGTLRPPEDAPPLRALRGEVLVDEPEVTLTPSGELRHLLVNAAPVRDREGAIIGSVSVARDVTDWLAAQEELHRRDMAQAAQEERSRLARDLHDSVTQALFAATLKVEALTTTGEQTSVSAALEDVRRLNRGALAQMRTMLLELRGDPVAEVPLQQLLRHLVEGAESRASVKAILKLDERAPLPPAVHEAVYRIAQEALNNVVRHAKAENAWVQVRTEGEGARLVVGDDGQGFDPASVAPGHFGLAFMRERATETGGELSVTSSAGEGTVVIVDWPSA